MTLGLLTALAFAEPPTTNPHGEEIVAHAERWLGKPYAFASDKKTTLNCLDVVFYGLRDTFGERGVRYQVDPIAMIDDPHLGEPVEGLTPALRGDLDAETLALMQPGDVIYFLLAEYPDSCPRCEVTTLDGTRYGGWHTALSRGGDKILHAKPGADVRRDVLESVRFDALWVSRRVE